MSKSPFGAHWVSFVKRKFGVVLLSKQRRFEFLFLQRKVFFKCFWQFCNFTWPSLMMVFVSISNSRDVEPFCQASKEGEIWEIFRWVREQPDTKRTETCGLLLRRSGSLVWGGDLERQCLKELFSSTSGALCAKLRGNSLTLNWVKRLEVSKTLNYRFTESEKEDGRVHFWVSSEAFLTGIHLLNYDPGKQSEKQQWQNVKQSNGLVCICKGKQSLNFLKKFAFTFVWNSRFSQQFSPYRAVQPFSLQSFERHFSRSVNNCSPL